jgi:Tol biopolymer transport system component
MNADGTNARVFIDTPGKVDAGPLWGADGRFVAFSTESFVGAQDGQIVVAEVDGKGRDQITSGSGGNVQPAIK